jgi:hypothetical protein
MHLAYQSLDYMCTFPFVAKPLYGLIIVARLYLQFLIASNKSSLLGRFVGRIER